MSNGINRRALLGYGLAAPAVLTAGRVWATTLDDVRSAGAIRIGLVNQPPYSALNLDGSIGGFVPTVTAQVMAKLGVERIEPFVVSYGELIPGLQAGRWQMIAASFRLTKERCEQVLFTDPITFDGAAIAYVADAMPEAPSNISDLADGSGMVGILQGSYLVQRAIDLGIPENRISQFPSNPALIDGLEAGRIGTVVSTNAALSQLKEQRGGYEIAYPLSEDPPVGSAPAFSPADPELHAAFQQELRAMRDSGALQTIADEFGFPPPPDDLAGISAEEACGRL